MPKQTRTLPARRHKERSDDSLLIRSAESLGRMIGSLQRQLDAARQLAGPTPRLVNGDMQPQAADERKRVRKAATANATKTRPIGDGKSKRAARSAPARKGAKRSRSGAKRSAKSSRGA